MDPFIGEIRAFPYQFAPVGWLECTGQSVTISQYQALFAIIGLSFGGDGKTTFKLPDMRGLAAVGVGTGPQGGSYHLGRPVGSGSVTLSIAQIPPHSHILNTQVAQTGTAVPDPTVIPTDPQFTAGGSAGRYAGYASPSSTLTGMASNSLGGAGAGMPHDNHSPYLVFLWCIATEGIFPALP